MNAAEYWRGRDWAAANRIAAADVAGLRPDGRHGVTIAHHIADMRQQAPAKRTTGMGTRKVIRPEGTRIEKRDGQRSVQGGRPSLTRGFYIAAISAARYNPALRVFYQRLRAAQKPPKCALIAVARKLLVLANTLIAQNRMWQPNPP